MSKNKTIFILQGTNRVIIFFVTLSVLERFQRLGRAILQSIHSSQPLRSSRSHASPGLCGLAAAAAKDKTSIYNRMLFPASKGQKLPGKVSLLMARISPTLSFNLSNWSLYCHLLISAFLDSIFGPESPASVCGFSFHFVPTPLTLIAR